MVKVGEKVDVKAAKDVDGLKRSSGITFLPNLVMFGDLNIRDICFLVQGEVDSSF